MDRLPAEPASNGLLGESLKECRGKQQGANIETNLLLMDEESSSSIIEKGESLSIDGKLILEAANSGSPES